MVSVLDLDPGLAELVPAEQRAQARQATSTSVIQFPSGPWREPDQALQRINAGYGLLMLDGLLLRRVEVAGRHAAELLGPGDLLRPWQHDGDASTLELAWTWRVVAPTKVRRARSALGAPRRRLAAARLRARRAARSPARCGS